MDTKVRVVKLLKEGLTQKEIAIHFQELNIKPNSLSMIEKYLKEIRESYGARTLFHLACIMNDNNELNLDEEEEINK